MDLLASSLVLVEPLWDVLYSWFDLLLLEPAVADLNASLSSKISGAFSQISSLTKSSLDEPDRPAVAVAAAAVAVTDRGGADKNLSLLSQPSSSSTTAAVVESDLPLLQTNTLSQPAAAAAAAAAAETVDVDQPLVASETSSSPAAAAAAVSVTSHIVATPPTLSSIPDECALRDAESSQGSSVAAFSSSTQPLPPTATLTHAPTPTSTPASSASPMMGLYRDRLCAMVHSFYKMSTAIP